MCGCRGPAGPWFRWRRGRGRRRRGGSGRPAASPAPRRGRAPMPGGGGGPPGDGRSRCGRPRCAPRRRRLGGAGRQPEGDDRRKGLGELRDRALAVEPALVHEADAVGPLLRLFQVVGGEHDRGPRLAQPVHSRPERVAGLDVQPRGGLVEDHQLGPAVHGSGEVQTTFLPTGELGDDGARLAGETHDAEHPVDGVVPPAQGADQGDRLPHRQVRGEAALLQHDAHPRPNGLSILWARAEDPHRAGGGSAVPLDDFQGGGLARSVRAEKGVELAAVDLEGQVADGSEVAVGDGEAVDVDDRRVGHLVIPFVFVSARARVAACSSAGEPPLPEPRRSGRPVSPGCCRVIRFAQVASGSRRYKSRCRTLWLPL